MQESPQFILKPLRRTLILVGVMLVFLGSGSAVVRYYVLPQRMESLLHEAPAAQISSRMDHLLTSAPLPHQMLAQLLASPRAEVSAEAAQRLELLLQEWEQRPGHEIADEAMVLVEELRRQFSACSPTAQQHISKTVGRMAGWDLGTSAEEQAAFLTAIEEVAKAASQPLLPAPAAANEAMLSQYLQDSPPATITANPITPSFDETFVADLSAGLPWDPVELPRVPGSRRSEASPSASIPFTPTSGPNNRPTVRAGSAAANQPLAVSPPLKLPRLLDEPLAVESIHHEPENTTAFDKLTTWEVIWKLHEPQEERVAQAEAELTRRRFGDADLELARRISSPELATRLQAVRELPLMSRADATVWLYYMTKDPDETVRYAAAAALLTSADPRIHRQLKTDLASDPSLRVQELFQR